MRSSKLVLLTVVGLAALAWLVLGDTKEVVLTALATSALAGIVILVADRSQPWRWLVVAVMTSLWCRRRLVRLSVSYLFRIKVESRYLLVASARWPGVHAPVGGVYKRLPGSTGHFRKLGALDDDCHPVDERSRFDLRVRVPGWKVMRFLRWFEREENRELSPWREFYEELVLPGYLPASQFRYIYYRPLGRRWTRPKWSAERNRFEMFVADIYEPVLTGSQEAAIAALPEGGAIRWVTEAEIRARGTVSNQQPRPNISERAIWIV